MNQSPCTALFPLRFVSLMTAAKKKYAMRVVLIVVFVMIVLVAETRYYPRTIEDLCEWRIPEAYFLLGDVVYEKFSENNITLENESQNAAIVYLGDFGSEKIIDSLEKSLEALYNYFLQWESRYPVYVYFESSHRDLLTPTLKSRLQAATNNLNLSPLSHSAISSSSPMKLLSFHEIIDFEEIPSYVNRSDIPAEYGGRGVGYRFMCRFWAYGFFNQPSALNLRYYWRLDTDLFLRRAIRLDPFQYMEVRNIGYFHGVSAFESHEVVIGLWDTALEYMRVRRIYPDQVIMLSNVVHLKNHHEQAMFSDDRSGVERVLSMPLDDAIDHLKSAGYNAFMHYNNFELSRVDIWRSVEYLDFFFFVDRAGGILTRRWGDAPIRTLALAVMHDSLRNKSSSFGELKVEQWGGLCYQHQGYRGTL